MVGADSWLELRPWENPRDLFVSAAAALQPYSLGTTAIVCLTAGSWYDRRSLQMRSTTSS